jgi:hypothetical protein
MKMPYKEIIKMYSERKSKLIELLNENSHGLDPERLYSIKGAVDEIELFLNTLSQHQERAVFYEGRSQPGLCFVEEAVLKDNDME